jgi:uncharacterized protein (DUF608 family)
MLTLHIMLQPTDERREALGNTIRSCKTSEALKKFGEAAVVFIISRVGSSLEAEEFLDELDNDEELKEWVYCSKDRLDEQSAVIQRVKDDVKYTKNVSSRIVGHVLAD